MKKNLVLLVTLLFIAPISDAAVDFEGTVTATSNACTGSLIRLQTSKEDDLGLILTNGHCTNLDPVIKFNEAVINLPVAPNVFNTFQLFDPSGHKVLGKIEPQKLIYATITGTDVALYQLKLSYRQIFDQFHVRPLLLSSVHPKVQDPIHVLIPNWWHEGSDKSCKIDHFDPELYLPDFDTKMTDSIRYTLPCIIGKGDSGAPIELDNSRTVVGVNNAGATASDGSPLPGWGQETYMIYGCLSVDQSFNIGAPGCSLYKDKVRN